MKTHRKILAPQRLWMVWVTKNGTGFRWGVYGEKQMAMDQRREARQEHPDGAVTMIRYDREDKPGVKKNSGKGYR